MKVKSHLGVLFLGIMLGVAVVLPVRVLASNWPPLFGNEQQAQVTHEQMCQMMDAVDGEGVSQRMHEVMGQDHEKMTAQCAAMMDAKMTEQCAAMMDMMQGMMGHGGMMSNGGMMGRGMSMGR